ncbi:sulfite exporter TauE/SafE family protein [Staphylococcus sp. NRL 19/737]|nr:sulfite exporter TauE/SafE family protein [Staphylococcus sp. NRL 19/737]MCJ1667191.1 sulfite exporter TauE/SafE family protein [Staphylococcus sp. NRL 19/737]
MRKLFIFALAGFLAQLVDGSLGMGFGASSSSILLTYGIAPAIVSATVHFSEIATTAASGTSHWKFENVHKPTMLKLAILGAISGFIGAALLTRIHGNYIKPYIALFLLSMGIYILYQFLFKRNKELHTHDGKLSSAKLMPQGAIAGFLDAIGGGGWGPVNTPLLLASHKIQPRYAIGTVSASEFFVTLSTSISFILFLGITQINWWFVIALSVGGMVAAPISAYLTKILPINILAICVGGLIIFTNSNALMKYLGSDGTITNIIRFAIICAIVILIIITLIRNKKLSFSYK